MKRILAGAAVALVGVSVLVVCGIGRGPVAIKVLDPRLSIAEARIVYWATNVCWTNGEGAGLQYHPTARYKFDRWFCAAMHAIKIPADVKIGASVSLPPEYIATRKSDWLILFGTLPGGPGDRGFDLRDSRGGVYPGDVGNPAMSGRYGRNSRRQEIKAEFATVNWLPLNTHGDFFLTMHDQTNVLAMIRIR